MTHERLHDHMLPLLFKIVEVYLHIDYLKFPDFGAHLGLCDQQVPMPAVLILRLRPHGRPGVRLGQIVRPA